MQILAKKRSLEDIEDEALARRAPKDFAAFSELYRRYLCQVYRYMRARVSTDGLAEDLTAEVFFKALSRAASYRADSNYSSWLFSIARNTLSSSRRGERAIAVGEVPDSRDPGPSPATQAVVGEQRDIVWDTIVSLPPAQREVVVLRYLRDLSTEEVAQETGRTGGNVRILLHRARARLRRALEGRGVR